LAHKEGQPVKHREVWQAIVTASRGREVKWHSLKEEVRPAESRQAEELARQTPLIRAFDGLQVWYDRGHLLQQCK
jgi:ribonuclease HI